MNNKKVSLAKLFTPADTLPIIIILIGMVFTIFYEDIAIRLIGLFVAILAGVRLFMVISSRFKDVVANSRFLGIKPPVDIKETQIKDKNATHKVYEGFTDSYAYENETEEKSDPKKKLVFGDEEVIPEPKPYSETIQKPKEKSEQTGSNPKTAQVFPQTTEFNDDFSSVKIKRKIPAQKTAEEPVQSQNKTEDKPVEAAKKAEENIKAENVQDVQKIEKEQLPVKKIDTKYIEKELNIPASAWLESEIIGGQEPRKEFEFYLTRILMLIRSITNTKTACFFLVNMEKREFTLETYLTDYPEAFSNMRKIPFGNDIVSQIVANLKPEILTEINPSAELDLIPYYLKSVETSSFVGVPVFYKKSVMGVICADTSENDAYDSVTIGFLGHFTKLIGSLMQSYSEKYELLQSTKTLDLLCNFRHSINNSELSLKNITNSLLESAMNIFDYNHLGLCLFDEELKNWKVAANRIRKIPQDFVQMQDKLIDVDNSVIGECLTSSRTVVISPISNDITRIMPEEPNMLGGYFVAVPIISLMNIYGAIYLEGKSSSSLTQYDVKILESLGENLGIYMEQLNYDSMLSSSSMKDTQTGVLNQNAFSERLNEELVKSTDFKTSLSLCTFQIDNYSAVSSQVNASRVNFVAQSVVSQIKQNLRPYNVLGKVSNNAYGLVLFGTSMQNAHLWAERLRTEIARNIIYFESKKFNITISIGIAEYNHSDSTDEFIIKSQKALNVAAKKTNSVSVYS